MENIFPKRNFTAHNSAYDGVFAGPPKLGIPTLAPRLEDYDEIFGGFHFSRPISIPTINLPDINDEYRSSSVFDYHDVFGELGDFDCAASYEDLFGKSSGGLYDSSDEAWSRSQSEAFSDDDINRGKDFRENVTERKRYKKFTLDPTYRGFENDDFNPSENPRNSVSSSDKPFITISDISLRTKPTQLPPPSRPPPPLTLKNNEFDGSNSAHLFDVIVDSSSCDEGTVKEEKRFTENSKLAGSWKEEKEYFEVVEKEFRKTGNKMKGRSTKELIKKKEDSKLHVENVAKMEEETETYSKSNSFESEEMKESHRIQGVGSVPYVEKMIKAEKRFAENSKLAGSWNEEKEYFEVVEKKIQKNGNQMKGRSTKELIKKKEDLKLHVEDVAKMMDETFSKINSFESEEMKESQRIQGVGSVPYVEKMIKAEKRFFENSKLAGSWKEEREYFEVFETNFQNNGKHKENIEIEEVCRKSVDLDIGRDETSEEVKENIGHEESEKPQKEIKTIVKETVEHEAKKLFHMSVDREKMKRNKSEKDSEKITEMINGKVLEDDKEQKESRIMKEKNDNAFEREENITGRKGEEKNELVKEVNEGLVEGEERNLSDEENDKNKKIHNSPKRVSTEDEIRGSKIPNINIKNKEGTLDRSKSVTNPRLEKGILTPKDHKLTSGINLENEHMRKMEEEERQREREKDRMTVDRTALEDRTRRLYSQRPANAALSEKNRRDLLAQREREDTNRVVETLDAQVKRWSSGKEGNLRALLSTLQYILGSDSGWKPVPLTELITCASVKKSYRRATLCVHPDKVQQRGATMQQKYICDKVFELLKEAWNKFNSEER